MIIDFNINFKGYIENILHNYRFFTYKCPKCGAEHSFVRHGSYERNLVFLEDGNWIESKMNILRLKCTSCGSTHAILPNDVVPYCIYSYSYMLHILSEHFINNESVLSLSKTFYISFQLIYSFISRFTLFIKQCILLLRAINLIKTVLDPSFSDVLKNIKFINNSTNFFLMYFIEYRWPIFMTKFQKILPCPIFIGSSNP